MGKGELRSPAERMMVNLLREVGVRVAFGPTIREHHESAEENPLREIAAYLLGWKRLCEPCPEPKEVARAPQDLTLVPDDALTEVRERLVAHQAQVADDIDRIDAELAGREARDAAYTTRRLKREAAK
jgi:hypothetical protein